nr:protein transport protein SEC31 [Drosophila suzukii]
MMQRCSCVLAVLVLLWSGGLAQLQVQAQSGYNYGRPEVSNVGGATAGGRLAPGPYPTASAIPLTPAPATTAYGAGLFPSPAVGFTPSGQATTAFGAPAVVGGSNAVSQPRRTSSGGLPNTSSRGGPYGPQTSQYGNAPGGSPIRVTSGTGDGGDYNDGEGDYSAIPGVPGVDYPIYAQVPRTNFDCSQQPLPGYYADIEAQCQVFHICALNRTYSFLCPNGTVFSQETLVCVWWNQYDCVSAPSLYANNAYIYDYSGGSGSNLGTSSANNAYRPAAAATTAFGAPVATAGTLRATGVPQVSGYNSGRGSYPSATPTPAAQAQSAYGAGAVLRPAIVPSAGANRLPPSGAAVGLLATAAGSLQDNSVAGFGQQQQPQLVTGGNREYLPPASIGQRQRGGTSA